ncbi:hypothetical protein ACA910_016930 [Epithemia clementina (nom. ined.)]
MKMVALVTVVLFGLLCCPRWSVAFQTIASPQLTSVCKPSWRSSPIVRSMGLLDDMKLVFGEEGKKKREEKRQREIDEQEAIQREILERRRNPEKMQQYFDDRKERLKKFTEDRDVYKFQNKVEKGYDPLTDWKRLCEEGKIKVGEDVKRDESSARLGSEGLQDVRVDERMPYIDQGYVEEKKQSDDPLGQLFGNLFGKK